MAPTTAAKEDGYALSAEAGAAEGLEPRAVVVEPAREVPGLGLVHPLDVSANLTTGSAIVNARGELVGVAIAQPVDPIDPPEGKHGGSPHAVLAYLAPTSRPGECQTLRALDKARGGPALQDRGGGK